MTPEALIEAIEVAFDGVQRAQTSLRQYQLTDQYGLSAEITKEDGIAAGKVRSDQKWQDIPAPELEACDCLLAHMPAADFTYYLPAYLRYALNHYQESRPRTQMRSSMVCSLYPSQRDRASFNYTAAQLSLLNAAQKRVVVQFLELIATEADWVEQPDAQKALERYWYRQDLI